MSTALRIAHGTFGRVALLDMDCSLVRHAHPHCHVLLKVEGADTQFVVGETDLPAHRRHPRSSSMAGSRTAYVHVPERPRTRILALYIEPEWLKIFRPGWAASGGPGFLQPSVRAGVAAHPPARDGSAAEMMARPDAQGSARSRCCRT